MLNLRRLVNKESPLWGFLVGLTLTGAVVAVTDTAVLRPLENVALDVRFRNRPPIPLSPELIMVDIDDDSINFLGPLPWARDRHAGVVRQLHDLGARVIVMDIRFVRPLPDLETPFDPQAGRFEPDAVNERLVRSVGGAGNVLVVYEFDIGQALPPADLMAAVPRMAELLGKDANADEERLQGASGLSPKRYASAANLLRRLGLQAAITERVRGQSGLTYLDIESKLFPNGPLSPRHLLDVRIAWDVVQAKGMVRGKGSQAIEGGSVATQDGLLTNPPMLDLGEAILASGLTNATVDADGLATFQWTATAEGPATITASPTPAFPLPREREGASSPLPGRNSDLPPLRGGDPRARSRRAALLPCPTPRRSHARRAAASRFGTTGLRAAELDGRRQDRRASPDQLLGRLRSMGPSTFPAPVVDRSGVGGAR